MQKSDIKVAILGGQDERGKNCFFIETIDSIYIFNAGVKIPLNSNLGISKISASFDYLVENQRKIKGLFIGNQSFFNIGAIKFLLKKLDIKLDIYTSLIGQTIIESSLEKKSKNDKIEKENNYEIFVCDSLKEILFKDTKIIPFKVSSHIPFSFGWVVKTELGNIVIIDEFYVHNDKSKLFESQLNSINSITKGKNTLLLVGAGNIEKNKGFTSPYHKTTDFYESIVNQQDGPILIALNEYNVYSLLVLASIAKKTGRPFILYSISFISTFSSIIRNKLFSSKNLNSLPIQEINKAKNPIIIMMGSEENIFKTLYSIIDYQVSSIQPKDNWTFVLGTYLIPGYETHAAKLADELDRKNIKYYLLPKTIMPLTASNEDHKFLIDMLKPKHIIPIGSLYMNLVKYQKVLESQLPQDSQIHILENSDVFVLSNEKSYIENNSIKNLNDVYINESGYFDVNDSILLERKQMSTSGVVTLIMYFNRETQSFINKIELNPIGLTFNADDYNFQQVKEKFIDTIQKCIIKTKNGIDIKETKIALKKSLIRIFERKMNKKPLILPTIIEF